MHAGIPYIDRFSHWLSAAALAIWQPARPENRAKVGGIESRIQNSFEERMARMRIDRDEFERRHKAVLRFVIVADDAPRTRKGNVAHARIEAEYASIIEGLRADEGVPISAKDTDRN